MSSVSDSAPTRTSRSLLTGLASSRNLDDWIGLAALGCAVTSLASIAAASFCLGLGLALWLVRGLKLRDFGFAAPAFGPLIAAYVCSVTISIVFSIDPGISIVYVLKLLKLSLPFLFFSFLDRARVLAGIKVLFGAMAVSALVGLGQYFLWQDMSLVNRITGLMSHWMTFAGQLMLILITLLGFLLFDRLPAGSESGEGGWARRVVPSLAVGGICSLALLLTFTRNAWLGLLVGAALLILLWNWRWILPAGVAVVVLFVLLPTPFQQRVYDGFSSQDETLRGRIELLQTGANMVWANPITGVGPRMVPRSASSFRTRSDVPDSVYIHLHNSPLQIAAEFGLLTLVIWLALWIYVMQSLWRLARRHASDREVRFLAVTGLASIVAFLCAGVLEFNFGDAEVIILLLFLITAPYVVARESKAA